MIFYLMRLILLSILISSVTSYRVVGWYNGIPPIQDIPWNIYTHIKFGEPIILANGSASCNRTQMSELVTIAHQHNSSIIWGTGLVKDTIPDKTPDLYWKTIGDAMHDCRIDGIEVDYEHVGSLGIVTPSESNKYTRWLTKLKRNILGTVSADISIWGLAPGNYILGILPWINVTMLNMGMFDYINTMSYHWNIDGNIWAWQKDIWVLTQIWGINPSRINLGIGYFSKQRRRFKLISEPSWATLSEFCPNIVVQKNICNNTLFVGKEMNYNIGQLAAKSGLGGLFPWELSYDSYRNNNTLIVYLVKGFIS